MRDAKENYEKKMAARNPGGEERVKVARPFFFLAVFIRVTHDGLSERETTCSLRPALKLFSSSIQCFNNLKIAVKIIYDGLLLMVLSIMMIK